MKPYYDHAGITIYHGDCREILPQIQEMPRTPLQMEMKDLWDLAS